MRDRAWGRIRIGALRRADRVGLASVSTAAVIGTGLSATATPNERTWPIAGFSPPRSHPCHDRGDACPSGRGLGVTTRWRRLPLSRWRLRRHGQVQGLPEPSQWCDPLKDHPADDAPACSVGDADRARRRGSLIRLQKRPGRHEEDVPERSGRARPQLIPFG
jgi:hypothetical protein